MLEVTRNEAGDADVYTLTRQLSVQEEAVKRAWEAVQEVPLELQGLFISVGRST